MLSRGSLVDPSPTIVEALNGRCPWLEDQMLAVPHLRNVDLAALRRPTATSVHDIVGRLICQIRSAAGKRAGCHIVATRHVAVPFTVTMCVLQTALFAIRITWVGTILGL